MASSLRRQVDALRHASSGTSSGYIQRKKGKPSLLLTPDQAADVDLSSVRETAVMGLQRLEAVDQDFSPFQATLFSKEAEGTLRDLQTKEANDRIDQSISAFLALLSPHFSSREAHFCLEYLIRHYKVYQYNVDAVVECCLPWHDTLAFVRMVQLLSLKGSRWEFLTPVQKTGSPLPREAIARRCARDFGLLRFLCVSARSSAARAASSSAAESSVSAATAAGRAKLFSFYAAVVVEALASLGSASEPLLRALVPTVVHGLSATRSPEYQMASYMILSALSGKGPLSPEVTSTALTALVCKPCQGGLEPSLLCALAVAQTQVGFSSKNSSTTGGAPLMLPTPAFKKLSGMKSLAGVLAGLAQKFDATAFLWLLLQSYVQHLPDEDSEHGKSLTSLCTYPYWPSHSLPRLVKRLVDRLIRAYLTVTLEGVQDEMEVEDGPEKRRRSTAMKTESQRVLRVLGQRFPQEVDSAVAKISRNVAKTKAASLREDVGGGDDDSDDITAATREAALREEALSSLLVSTFAGAELAHRLPLEEQQGEDGASGGVHSSLMVALEHSSGAVRARAIEQLSRAMSASEAEDAAGESTAAAGEDVSPALLRRLQDEDPEVVLAITGSDYLVQQVLLRPATSGTSSEDDKVTDVSDFVLSIQRATLVTSASAAAAVPWLSALSEARPKHAVASSGRVLSGLLRLAAAAAACAAALSCRDVGEEGLALAKQARDSALSLCLECLPGPSAVARVKLAQQLASASVGVSGAGDAAAATATAAGKACKKAMRAVNRAAIEAVSGLSTGTGSVGVVDLFAGITAVLEQEVKGDNKASKSPSKNSKNKGKISKAVDDMEVERSGKSKGLKAMGEEVCGILATALVDASQEESKMEELQVLSRTSGAGGRWLVLESVSRAVSLAFSSSSTGTQKARATAKAAASSLATLLACVATFELHLRPSAFSDDKVHVDAESAGAVGATGILRYLRVCATHLAAPEHPSSLHADDHLTVPAVGMAASDKSPSASGTCAAAVTTTPVLGDVLVSVLKATAAVPESAGSGAVWEAVSAVVLLGYEQRPLSALAAVTINGVSPSGAGGGSRRSARQQKRGGGTDAKVVAATRALCVASTFVRAAAEAAIAGDSVNDEESMAVAETDVVAIFPAAMLAVASDDKGLRDGGNLFISTVAAHGDALIARPASASASAAEKGSQKRNSASAGVVSEVEDSEFFPPLASWQQQQQSGEESRQPSPLKAPTLASVVELASALADRNRESPLDALELSRHLASTLGGDDDVARYLVAWGARLGWRDPFASTRLLECLTWAKTPMRECCLPLLRHCLDSERSRNDTNNGRLLNLLLRVTLTPSAAATTAEQDKTSTKSPKKTPRGKKGKEKTVDAPAVAATVPASVFESAEAEKLMHRALRTPGQAQTVALRVLSSSAKTKTTPSGEGGAASATVGGEDAVRQRRDLVVTLVEVGLTGADGSMVAAAARALPARPCDLAAILSGLGPTSAGTATSSKARKKQSSATPASATAGGETAWVPTVGGIVELAQALCGPPSASTSPDQQHQPPHKGDARVGSDGGFSAAATSAEGWGWAAPLELARPLFDVLPDLLAVATSTKAATPVPALSSSSRGTDSTASECVVDDAEYALWLTMDVLGGVLRRWGKGAVGGGGGSTAAERLYKRSQAGDDAETVLTCVRENPSPQTRNSGLALLSRMATLFPAQMASRLRTLLDTVCATAAGSEGFSGGGGGARVALRQTQKAVQSVVPALKAHGAEVGVGAQFVVEVFVDALDDAPVHARRALFSTLIDSLGEESLAIMSTLLLRRAVSLSVSCDGDVDGGGVEERTTALVEFVHQTVHCSGARAQVRTLVGLVQTCHRLSVSTAERSGKLSGQSLKDAIDCFAQDLADGEEGKVDYLHLSLERPREAAGNTKNTATPAFMTMDLRSLSDVHVPGDAAGAKKKAAREGKGGGKFLEEVLAFVRDHLVSRPLLMAVAAAAERGANGKGEIEGAGIQESFLLLCMELLLLLRTLSACDRSSSSADDSDEPSWSSLQGLTYAVFETLQSLLSARSFAAVTQDLLQNQDPHLRRKALQMLTQRLDPAGRGSGGAQRLTPEEEDYFVEMVPSLRSVAMGKKAGGPLPSTEENEAMESGLEEVMGPSAGATDAMDEEKVEGAMVESAVNRQTALLSLDVLARVLGRRHQDAFVGVLDDVTEIVAGEGPGALLGVNETGADGILPLRASAFLLLATLCAVLGVQAFPRLPRFFPAMLQALESQTTTSMTVSGGGGGHSLLWTSSLSAVATVAASLPSFLSPYLGRILAVALKPAAAAPGSGGGSAAAGSKQAADRVLSLLAAGVEPRLLVPAVCGTYAGCVDGIPADADEERVVVAARSVARLLAYVQEIVAGLEKEAASAALPQFTRLLTLALDFRRQHAHGSAAQVKASAELVESEASSSLVCLVMRLSEVELRPLFLHLCEWKAGVSGGDNDPKAALGALDRRLSFYRVLDGLAGALKSIFTPYFAHVLTDCCDDMEAASLLATSAADGPSAARKKRKRGERKAKEAAANKRKRRKTLSAGDPPDNDDDDDGGSSDEEEEEDDTPELRWRRSSASRLVLSALRRCFQSDRSGFVNKTRFDLLLPAVVAQLDCGSDFAAAYVGVSASSRETEATDEVSSCRLHAEELVGPCLAQLASASGKDALWKAMANAVLMKTRSKRAGVRVAALVSLRQCFEVMGEEFLALLPECLPFLSELLEDGHPEVESEYRALVKYIEGILGESIESYLV